MRSKIKGLFKRREGIRVMVGVLFVTCQPILGPNLGWTEDLLLDHSYVHLVECMAGRSAKVHRSKGIVGLAEHNSPHGRSPLLEA